MGNGRNVCPEQLKLRPQQEEKIHMTQQPVSFILDKRRTPRSRELI
jgi:hypothetical protein